MKKIDSNNVNNPIDSSTAVDDNLSKKEDSKKKPKLKKNIWWIKATIITLLLAAFVGYLSNLTAESGNIAILVILLFILIVLSIVFDCIGVAVTSCDETPIISMSSRKIYGSKTALWLKKHSDTVASICNDIIGDIFGIISGTCAAALVIKLVADFDLSKTETIISIAFSAVVSALTIGGKAFMKTVAISKSNQIVMGVSKVIAVFSKEERKRKKKESKKSNEKNK